MNASDSVARWMLACLLLMAAAGSAAGQDHARRAPATQHAHKSRPARARKASKRAHRKHAHSRPHAADKPAPTQQPPAPQRAEADDADVHKEGDTEVKSVEFSGLDIEGQLKSPQMLYFLNRLRAQFDRPQLPHRSFMPELQRTTKEDVF